MKKILIGFLGLISALVCLFLPENRIILLVATLLGMLVIMAILYKNKKIEKFHIMLGVMTYLLVVVIIASYAMPSFYVSLGQGPIIDSPGSGVRWDTLNWIKSNTKECAVIATYWDPGHFITGVSRRPVIYDGASQSALITLNSSDIERLGIDATKYTDGINLERYDKGILGVIQKTGDNLTYSRMKDVAGAMYTDNESLAVSLLKKYQEPGCDEMYFLASSDLLGKSTWWTYFSTFDPTNDCDTPLCKGTPRNYVILQSSGKKPIFSEGVVGYEYPVAQLQSIIVYQKDNNISAVFQAGNKFVKIKHLIVPSVNGTYTITNDDAEVTGTVLLIDPSMGSIMYIPADLENAMFTRLMLFDGKGLQNFELVQSWGSEVKLYRIRF